MCKRENSAETSRSYDKLFSYLLSVPALIEDSVISLFVYFLKEISGELDKILVVK